MSNENEIEFGPTTDCATFGRSAKDCNDGAAKGWDNCCQVCDERGRIASHWVRIVEVRP